MTAGVQSAQGLAAAASLNYSASIVIPVAGFTGFISGSGGSITPTSLKGVTIDACGTSFSGVLTDFEFSLNSGALAQDFFTGILVQRTNGTWVRYSTASATFSAGTGTWAWGSGSDPAWTAAPDTRLLIIFP